MKMELQEATRNNNANQHKYDQKNNMQVKVTGDFYELKHQGIFNTRKDLSWQILKMNNNSVIVTIPVAYGEEKIKFLLSTRYLFHYAKSIEDKYYYVIIQNIPDQAIINELNNL